MKKLNYDIIYFIGIGGIGMSALARWFTIKKYKVFGYDKTRTELTSHLEKEGITIYFEDTHKKIPPISSKKNTLVIYTPAIPTDNKELAYFKDNGYEVKKRAEVLGIISRTYFTVAVAGTHGKTTISSLLTHLLHFSGIDTTGFIGGISTNFNSNLVVGKTERAINVIEADEFDKSFLHLSPNIAIITSVDSDHLDIYKNASAFENTFLEFTNNLKENGKLLISKKANKTLVIDTALEYGLDSKSIRAENLEVKKGTFTFDFVDETTRIDKLTLCLPGFHNIENALVAIKTALILGLTHKKIREGTLAYKGVKRRFEYIFKSTNSIYIDDYAHHPKEIEAFIQSIKALYPNKKLTLIFQPHLFSRTQDFATNFARALDEADQVWLLDIYPARELPIEGVDASLILNQMKLINKEIIDREKIIQMLKRTNFEVLATLGAGDISTIVPKIKSMLIRSNNHA